MTPPERPRAASVPPWFRLYHEISDDPKLARLSEVMRWRYLLVLIMNHKRQVPCSNSDAAYLLRVTESDADVTLKELQSAGLITDGWRSKTFARRQFLETDHSAIRMQKLRKRRKTKRAEIAGQNSESDVTGDVTDDVTRDVTGDVTSDMYVTPSESESEPEPDTDSESDTHKKAAPSGAAVRERQIKSGQASIRDGRRHDEIDLTELQSRYPKRAGGQSWAKAAKAVNARIRDGATMQQMIDGAERYQRFAQGTGISGQQFVMQASRFFGPEKHFLEDWALPPNKADVRLAANIDAVQQFLANGANGKDHSQDAEAEMAEQHDKRTEHGADCQMSAPPEHHADAQMSSPQQRADTARARTTRKPRTAIDSPESREARIRKIIVAFPDVPNEVIVSHYVRGATIEEVRRVKADAAAEKSGAV